MAFPESVVRAVWHIVGGRCECRRTRHRHPGIRCNKELVWENRGREGRGAWEAHHIDGNTSNDVHSNCEILCWDCHKSTL